MGRWLTTIKLSAEGLGVFAAGTWLVDHFLFDWLVRYLDGYGIHEADLIATVSSYVLPALISIAIVLFTYRLVKRGNGEDLMETRNDIKSPNAGRETLVVGAIPARLQTEDFSKVHARIRVLVSEGNELIRSYTNLRNDPAYVVKFAAWLTEVDQINKQIFTDRSNVFRTEIARAIGKSPSEGDAYRKMEIVQPMLKRLSDAIDAGSLPL